MGKKLVCICFLVFLGNQFLTAQADHISWEFRGGKLLRNIDGTSTGPGPEPAGLDVAEIPNLPRSFGRLRSAVLGDLDGDNDLDFISGSQAGNIHYFENNGTTTAPNWVAASIPTIDTIWIHKPLTSRNQNRPQLVDIDNDDDLDLFIGTDYDYEGDRDNDILFYRNVGTPQVPIFEFVPECLPGLKNKEIAEYPGMGFVDLDNDTDLDLVCLGSDKLTYFKNIGNINTPIFELQSEMNSPWDDEDAYSNMDVPIPVFEDFDKDGDYDMFFMIDTGFVRWIENIGTPTNPDFGNGPQKLFNGELTNGEIGSYPTIDFGDVDGDGLKDAILGSFNVPRFAWFRQVPICINPSTPTLSATAVTCEGETSTITISGTLNIAKSWRVYSDSCGGTLIGSISTNGGTLEVTPNAPGSTYYIRAEDGDLLSCIDESSATCETIFIPVSTVDDAGFSYADSLYCKDQSNPTPTITGLTGGTFSAASGLSIDSDTGTIDINASTPGLYTVTYTTTGTCPNSSNVAITITALDDASFSYADSLYCKDQSNPTPTITGLSGGTFSAASGLSIDEDTGTIDINASTPGLYTVTYTTAGTCPNASDVAVTITALDDASFSYADSLYCKGHSNPTPTITGLSGGTFSAPSGLSIDSDTGTIDINASTPGLYTVTYTTAGTCPNSSDVTITITALDDASFSYADSLYCKDQSNPTPTITGLTGGAFSAASGLSIDEDTGTIDINASTPGLYTVTYTTAGTCPNASNVAITITALDDASFSYADSLYCKDQSNPTPTITGLSGGTFSAASGLSIDEDTGTIDINASTPGLYTVTYTTAGTCPNASNVAITITALDDAGFSYADSLYCKDQSNPTPTITGLSGGTFSAASGLSIDQDTGTIDINASTPGLYTVTYTTAGTCPNANDITITITALDDASFSYADSLYCKDHSNPTPTITGLSGGTFSAASGLSIDEDTGTIDINASTPGLYMVTYTTAGTCPNSSDVTITITALDDASFNYADSLYCKDQSNPTPTITGLTGGTFSAASGLSIDEDTGTIDINASTPGLYTVTYTTAGTCPNSSDVTIHVMELVTTITRNFLTLSVPALPEANYQWYDCEDDHLIVGETNPSYTVTHNGSFAVVVTVNGCTKKSSCFDIKDFNSSLYNLNTLKVYPNPTSEMVNITLDNLQRVTVYNNHGRIVLVTFQNSFSISQLQSGIYFVEVKTNKGTTIKKIVKK